MEVDNYKMEFLSYVRGDIDPIHIYKSGIFESHYVYFTGKGEMYFPIFLTSATQYTLCREYGTPFSLISTQV